MDVASDPATVTTRWPYGYVGRSPGNLSRGPKRSNLEGGPSGTPQSQEESHLDNARKTLSVGLLPDRPGFDYKFACTLQA